MSFSATMISVAAFCNAVATASLRSFLLILIDQSVVCTEGELFKHQCVRMEQLHQRNHIQGWYDKPLDQS